MKEIEELCDYIYILSNGTLIKKGTVKELAEDTFNRKDYVLKLYEQKSFSAGFLEEKLRCFDPSILVSSDMEGIYINSSENISLELSRLCAQEGVYIQEMYEREPLLEDTILQISKEVAK